MSAAPDRYGPEISDLVVDHDPETLARRPVARQHVIDALRAAQNPRAARIVEAFPATRGVLDPDHVDGVLVRSHLELQRLHEEFLMGRRVREVLAPVLDAIRQHSAQRPLRVVDIGCGMGFILRWLAAFGELGDDVTLTGVDYNDRLIRAARHLAEREGLRCTFVTGNAFTLDEPATLYLSTGAIHHFRGDDLARVFAQQDASPALAMVHYDIKPSWAAPVGAWIFHQARMREPLAQHDGYLSAVRAHPKSALVHAVKTGAPGFHGAMFDGDVPLLPILRIMHGLVGLRPALREPFETALKTDLRRVEWFA